MHATESSLANLAIRQMIEAAKARFWKKVVPDGECLRWTAAHTPQGYGNFHVGPATAPHTLKAHRVAYILEYGEIPAGTSLLHSCDHPWCVNHAHLRPGTAGDNLRDAYSRGRIVTPNAKKTHCKHGHEFTPENTRVCQGKRSCITCARAWHMKVAV